MNTSMISRRVGLSLTCRLYALEAEQGGAEGGEIAGVLAVLLLEVVPAVVVEERQQQLLAAGAEVAGGAVEGGQGEILEGAADPAGARQLAVLAGIADLHRLPLGGPKGDPVAARHQQRSDP